jgi:hypothetical protein
MLQTLATNPALQPINPPFTTINHTIVENSFDFNDSGADFTDDWHPMDAAEAAMDEEIRQELKKKKKKTPKVRKSKDLVPPEIPEPPIPDPFPTPGPSKPPDYMTFSTLQLLAELPGTAESTQNGIREIILQRYLIDPARIASDLYAMLEQSIQKRDLGNRQILEKLFSELHANLPLSAAIRQDVLILYAINRIWDWDTLKRVYSWTHEDFIRGIMHSLQTCQLEIFAELWRYFCQLPFDTKEAAYFGQMLPLMPGVFAYPELLGYIRQIRFQTLAILPNAQLFQEPNEVSVALMHAYITHSEFQNQPAMKIKYPLYQKFIDLVSRVYPNDASTFVKNNFATSELIAIWNHLLDLGRKDRYMAFISEILFRHALNDLPDDAEHRELALTYFRTLIASGKYENFALFEAYNLAYQAGILTFAEFYQELTILLNFEFYPTFFERINTYGPHFCSLDVLNIAVPQNRPFEEILRDPKEIMYYENILAADQNKLVSSVPSEREYAFLKNQAYHNFRKLKEIVARAFYSQQRYWELLESFGGRKNHTPTGDRYNAAGLVKDEDALPYLILSAAELEKFDWAVDWLSNRELKPWAMALASIGTAQKRGLVGGIEMKKILQSNMAHSYLDSMSEYQNFMELLKMDANVDENALNFVPEFVFWLIGQGLQSEAVALLTKWVKLDKIGFSFYQAHIRVLKWLKKLDPERTGQYETDLQYLQWVRQQLVEKGAKKSLL